MQFELVCIINIKMSDHVPFEIQFEIIKRLPVKSLIQFRTISKTWKSLIESSQFIIAYSSTQPQHLLVSDGNLNPEYFSVVVDDHAFLRHIVSPTIPLLFDMLKYSKRIIGSSHGLLCFYGTYERPGGPEKGVAVLWNLSIRKVVAVAAPNGLRDWRGAVFGFGVCPETADPKIVKITPDLEVEVFTLSTGAWRSAYENLPHKSLDFYSSQVVVDGFLYWLARDWISMDGERTSYNLIISFDMTTEVFGEVNLPDSAARKGGLSLVLFKLKESLVVIEPDFEPNNQVYHVWMVEDGVPKVFTKLYSVNTTGSVRGITNSGEPIIVVERPYCGLQPYYYYSVAVYEPSSKQIKNLGISGCHSFSVYPYMETLLLVDQPDFIIYDQGKHYILKGRAESLEEQNALETYKQDSRRTQKFWRFCKKTITQVYRCG